MSAPKENQIAKRRGPPLGSKNALGNKGGHPEKYTIEWLEKEAEALRQWMQLPESVFFKSFCVERGYSPQRLSEFADKSAVFAETLELAKASQECKLVNYGLFNKVNAGIAKFMLANHHGYTDKQQVTGDAANPLSFLLQKVDGKTKDLLNEDDCE